MSVGRDIQVDYSRQGMGGLILPLEGEEGAQIREEEAAPLVPVSPRSLSDPVFSR